MAMADRFEFVCWIQQCASALKFDLRFSDAIMLLDYNLPVSLLEQDTVKDLMAMAGDAVAIGLDKVPSGTRLWLLCPNF
eukprot:23099-Eustigmatos_ZCMA.PRE.1